ncbi:MAG: DUF4190 domain-containing protein [Lachnospiraceae bacterium]|nr:DUF4190 domain-containing protein [Lachnospiraceae bacterium]
MTTEENIKQELNQTETFTSENAETQYSNYDYTLNTAQPESTNKIGLSIASMVCGICSLVFLCVRLISIALALVSLSLGAIAITKHYRGKNMAVSGVICSIIALALVIISYILVFTSRLAFLNNLQNFLS